MTGLLDGEFAGAHDPRGRRRRRRGAARTPSSRRRGVRPVVLGVLGAELGGRRLRRRRRTRAVRRRAARGAAAPSRGAHREGARRGLRALGHQAPGPPARPVRPRRLEPRRSARPARTGPTGRSLAVHLRRRAAGSSSRPRSPYCSRCCAAARIPTRSPSCTTSSTTASPTGARLFRGIRRVGGGCHLELSDSGHVERRHWAPRYQPPLREPRGRPGRAAAPGARGRRGRRGGHRSNRSHVAERRTRLVSGGRRGGTTRARPEGDLGGLSRRARAR